MENYLTALAFVTVAFIVWIPVAFFRARRRFLNNDKACINNDKMFAKKATSCVIALIISLLAVVGLSLFFV